MERRQLLQAFRETFVILVLLVALLMGSAAIAQQRPPSLPSVFVERSSAAAPTLPEAGVVRQRLVDVRVDLLRRLQRGDAVELNLFDDVVLAASFDRLDRRGSDRFTWSGSTRSGRGHFALAVHDGVVAGSVSAEEGQFQIRYEGPSGYAVEQVDSALLPPELEPLLTAPAPGPPSGPIAADDGSVIDVMVVYTSAARAAAGGTAAMQALIALGETETNIAYDNSDILTNLNVVHTAEVAYVESGTLGTDLALLAGPSDGFMDEVHSSRDTHSADLVQLIVQNGDGCGIAFLMPGDNPLFAPMAFSVTVRPCVSPNYTFAHELGHNLGSNHAPEDPTGLGAFDFSFGFKDPSSSFRTVMAYNCPGGCPRVLQFSNPDVEYLRHPTGTASQNNASSINAVRTTVANFRSASGTCPTLAALAGHPEGQSVRRSLYGFRDRVLGRSPTGRLYTRLFYLYAPEVNRLLAKDPALRSRTGRLLIRLAPAVEAAASGRKAEVSREDLAEARRILQAFADRGSFSLKLAAKWLGPRLMDRKALESVGFEMAGRGRRAGAEK